MNREALTINTIRKRLICRNNRGAALKTLAIFAFAMLLLVAVPVLSAYGIYAWFAPADFWQTVIAIVIALVVACIVFGADFILVAIILHEV